MSIRKYTLALVILFSSCNLLYSQIDTMAVSLLDKMNMMLGDLPSVSFSVKTEYDINDPLLGLVTNTEYSEVSMKAPDKMLMKVSGERGIKEYYYNGKSFIYYSPVNKQYAADSAPNTIMGTIDMFSYKYGIDFPGSDFFYPYFTDDALNESNAIKYLGITKISGENVYHIAGKTPEFSYQLWINENTLLPAKMTSNYYIIPGSPNHVMYFSNWNLSSNLSDNDFQFSPPSGVRKIKFSVSEIK